MATYAELARIEKGPQTPQEHIWWAKYSHANLQRWRFVQDPEADAAVRAIGRAKPSKILEEVEVRAKTEGGPFQAFLDHAYQVPDWVDFAEMESGRRVYTRFAPLQGLVLLCSSLPEGYAFNKASQVLIQTGRLQKDVSRRIFETGQMLHNIAGPDGLRPGGIGHRTLMEVRLLHATVRYYIEMRGNWDYGKYEKPINQEDMAGTVLEFDFMVVRGMKKLGLVLSEKQRVSMHYFWRYAGYVLGVREELLTESYQEQEILALSLFSHLYSPTEDGKKLVHALLGDMAGKPPFRFPLSILYSVSNYLMGDLVAKDLEIPSTIAGRAVVEAIKASTRSMSLANRFMPEFLLHRLERDSFSIGRRALKEGLGQDPATWGFKTIA